MKQLKRLIILIALGLSNWTAFGQTTPTDTVKISLEQYRLMSTCPVYLNECEHLLKVDSAYIEKLKLKNAVIDAELKETKQKHARSVKNGFKFSLLSLFIGGLAGLLI